MNATQESKLNMFRATQKHCNDNPAIVATIKAFQTAAGTLNTTIASIIATAQQEDLITKGITIDKAEAKKTLCQLASDIAAPIVAYAAATKNNKLLKEVNFTHSDLIRTKDDQLAPRCKNIYDAAKANEAALKDYGITAATADTLLTTINDYQAKVPDPRNAAAQKATVRANLKNLIKEAEQILKLQMDKTVLGFKTSNPDFVKTYKSNRIIIDPSKTTTSLKGTITSLVDNTFIKGAAITIDTTSLKATTNETGDYEIKPIPSGTYTLKVSAPKYKDTVKTGIAIKQGQINKQDISIEPA
jgi:Carboxypeptidase regulatory-like domain